MGCRSLPSAVGGALQSKMKANVFKYHKTVIIRCSPYVYRRKAYESNNELHEFGREELISEGILSHSRECSNLNPYFNNKNLKTDLDKDIPLHNAAKVQSKTKSSFIMLCT